MHIQRTNLPIKVGNIWFSRITTIGVFFFCVFVFAWIFLPIQNFTENVLYALDPTPERAYTYGEGHFSATKAKTYELDRAEYFFDEVLKKDVSHPYLFHELARISFLRGRFDEALER